MARLYLDHAATTPIRPEAAAAMAAGIRAWANPSSPHAEGRAARAALEEARGRIGSALGWDGHVLLTSGASESIALAVRGRRVLASAVEHDAVWRAAPDAEAIAATPTVRAELVQDRLASAGAPADGFPSTAPTSTGAVAVVAIQHANSETGVLQPLADLAPAVRAAGAILLSDCAQTAGKIALPDADLIVVSAHKLGGPPGIGALLVRDLAMLTPTGGQEYGYRPGTENLPAALAFAAALEAPRDWLAHAARWRDELDAAIVAAGGEVIAASAARIATIASYRMPGAAAAAQLIRFDLAGIAVSAGSACASGSLKPSHALRAMGLPEAAATETIRVSFGWTTREEDIARFLDQWRAIAGARRERAA